MPLAAPVTRALRPVRSTSTEDLLGTIEASFTFLLHPETFLSRKVPSPKLARETSIGQISDVVSTAVLEKDEPLSRRRYHVHTLRETAESRSIYLARTLMHILRVPLGCGVGATLLYYHLVTVLEVTLERCLGQAWQKRSEAPGRWCR
jgi:hypothetical protein